MIDMTRIDPYELSLFLSLPTRWNLSLTIEPGELVCVSINTS
jgi:hypothetical protein